MNQAMTLQDALHHTVGALNFLMVEAHEKFGSEFEVRLVKDRSTGIYLIAVDVVAEEADAARL